MLIAAERTVSGSEHLDLPYVSVSPRVLILEDAYLDVARLDERLTVVAEGENIPAGRLVELDLLYLLQFVKTVCRSN